MRTPSSPAPGDPPGQPAEHPAGDPPQAPPGPAHRWETAARTRVPRSLLLLAAGGLAALAWTVLGPSAPEDGDVLAELPAAPVTAPATGPASPPPSRGSVPVPAPSAPSPGPTTGNGTLLVHVTGQVHRPGVVRDPARRVLPGPGRRRTPRRRPRGTAGSPRARRCPTGGGCAARCAAAGRPS